MKTIKKSQDMRKELKTINIDSLMPQNHLLRKIDKVIKFEEVYDITKSTTVRIAEDPAAIRW